MTTIKISDLGNLATFTDSTYFPVVNTSSVFDTEKASGATLKTYITTNMTSSNIAVGNLFAVSIGNIGTAILGASVQATQITASTALLGNVQAVQLGNVGTGLLVTTASIVDTATIGNLQAVAIGNVSTALTGLIQTPNQPNIIGLGNLTTLDVLGNLTAGSLYSDNYYFANGSPITYGNIGNLSVVGGLIYITPGTADQYIEIAPSASGNVYLNIPDDATANVQSIKLVNNLGSVRITSGNGITNYTWRFLSTGILATDEDFNIRANTFGTLNCSITANNTTINGNTIANVSYVPGANNSPGTAGQVSWDSDYVYICVAANTWKRANLSTW